MFTLVGAEGVAHTKTWRRQRRQGALGLCAAYTAVATGVGMSAVAVRPTVAHAAQFLTTASVVGWSAVLLHGGRVRLAPIHRALGGPMIAPVCIHPCGREEPYLRDRESFAAIGEGIEKCHLGSRIHSMADGVSADQLASLAGYLHT